VKTRIQRPEIDTPGFLLEFIPMKIGAGMTNPGEALFSIFLKRLRYCHR
jgi:hypothetical protein